MYFIEILRRENFLRSRYWSKYQLFTKIFFLQIFDEGKEISLETITISLPILIVNRRKKFWTFFFFVTKDYSYSFYQFRRESINLEKGNQGKEEWFISSSWLISILTISFFHSRFFFFLFFLWFREESNDQGRASVSRSRNWPQFPFHPRVEQARKN